jgi:hypothetical protein
VLSPDEIHRLANKTKRAMTPVSFIGTVTDGERTPSSDSPHPESSKLSCHSDYVDPEAAKQLQVEKAGRDVLVQVDVRPAMGIDKRDRTL